MLFQDSTVVCSYIHSRGNPPQRVHITCTTISAEIALWFVLWIHRTWGACWDTDLVRKIFSELDLPPLSPHVTYKLTDEVFLDEHSSPATYSKKLKLVVSITSKRPVTLSSSQDFVLTRFTDSHHRLSTSEDDSEGRFEYQGFWMRYIDIHLILPLS